MSEDENKPIIKSNAPQAGQSAAPAQSPGGPHHSKHGGNRFRHNAKKRPADRHKAGPDLDEDAQEAISRVSGQQKNNRQPGPQPKSANRNGAVDRDGAASSNQVARTPAEANPPKRDRDGNRPAGHQNDRPRDKNRDSIRDGGRDNNRDNVRDGNRDGNRDSNRDANAKRPKDSPDKSLRPQKESPAPDKLKYDGAGAVTSGSKDTAPRQDTVVTRAEAPVRTAVPQVSTSSGTSDYKSSSEDIARILSRDDCGKPVKAPANPSDEETATVVAVRFRYGHKSYCFDPVGITYEKECRVVVETAKGLELGTVCRPNYNEKVSRLVLPLRPVLRKATKKDLECDAANREREEQAVKVCVEKVANRGLDMKIVNAQYSLDNSKLLFHFTSPSRVDFRELVKDLAGVFHTRIELRQIGIKDEARMVGGLGSCGRPLCCSVFLDDFGQTSMKMVKDQNLSLNLTKISGKCGRLMCCLRYEYDDYADILEMMPSVGSFVHTPDGDGVVSDILALSSKIKVCIKNDNETLVKTYPAEQVIPIIPARQTPHTSANPGREPDSDE